jgi:hypothetical protein
MFTKFRDALAQKPGPDNSVCEIAVSLDIDSEIRKDPDFWPRLVLLPNGKLRIRARDLEEARNFGTVLTQFVLQGAPRDRNLWESAVIEGSTPHAMMLQFDPQAVRRVMAKIAYGVLAIEGNCKLDAMQDSNLRKYILGTTEEEAEPVSEAPESLRLTTGGIDTHHIVLFPPHDPSAAIVSLYGYSCRIEFGEGLRDVPGPIVIICNVDGSGIRKARPEEASRIIEQFADLTFRQPWLTAH